MKKLLVTATLVVLGTAFTAGLSWADDDEHEGGWFSHGFSRGPGVAPVNNELYASECGACHFAYQPGLLPARSWQRIMGSLDKHFGDNAELGAETRDKLLNYLVANAADRSGARRSQKIARSVAPNEAPLRITETRYIRAKHDEIPLRYIKDNPEVKSLSNCGACHQRAAQGDYHEGSVRIPGVGYWED
jgi:hypothetical protein